MRFIPLLNRTEEEESDWSVTRRPFIQSGLRCITMRSKMKEDRKHWINEETGGAFFSLEEDQLVLLSGLMRNAMDIQMQLGNEPSEDLLYLDAYFNELLNMIEGN